MKIWPSILLLLALNIFFIGHSQIIRGEVRDNSSDNSLADVNIVNLRTLEGTATRNNGVYEHVFRNASKQDDGISFSIIGFETKILKLKDLLDAEKIIYLNRKTEVLGEVSIKSTKTLKALIDFKYLNEMPAGIHSFGSTIFQDKIYVSGGDKTRIENEALRAYERSRSLNEFFKNLKANFTWEDYSDNMFVYNMKTDSWTTSKHNLIKRAYGQMIADDSNIYVLGGKRLSVNRRKEYLENKIEIISLRDDILTIDETNPHKAINAACIYTGTGIVLMGGSSKLRSDGSKILTDMVHYYDISSGLWYQLASLLEPKETNGVLIKDSIYILGGNNGDNVRTIEKYNFALNEWSVVGNLLKSLENISITTDGEIIYAYNENRIFTFDTNFNLLKEFPIDLALRSARIHFYKDKLIIMGGYTEFEHYVIPSSKVYSIDLKEFSITKTVSTVTLIPEIKE